MLKFILLTLSIAPLAFAQEETSDFHLQEINVFGTVSNPYSFEELPVVSKMGGQKLERKKQATLGETLSREAGVSSSFFGPNASRPIIRGLDGDRIRMLENSLGVLDASGASPDHAVSVDPLLIESIEVVRGPSALIYGSSAAGGVVNVHTNRIATAPIEQSEVKFSTRYTTVDRGRSIGAVARYQLGNFVFHLDGAFRGAENYSIPGMARTYEYRATHPLDPGETEDDKIVTNSTNRTSQGALGTSYQFENGYLGGALTGYLTNYGTVVEKAVKIDLDRVRFDLAGEWRKLGFFDSIRLKSAYTKYEHKELDDGEVGTAFRNRGIESRVDFKRRDLLFGVHQQYFKFSALGDEAFLPPTSNTSLAAFAFQEWHWGSVTPSLGIRLDRASVESETHPTFGNAVNKTYFVPNLSLGIQHALVPQDSPQQWTAAFNATYTERAPNYQELFANGAHVATNIFEVGDQGFKTERNVGVEVSLKTKSTEDEGRVAFFLQNYETFIALIPTGTQDGSSGLDIYQYQGIRAQTFGFEWEYTRKLPGQFLGGSWELEGKWDFVRGLDISHHASLPRMTPMRETIAVNYKHPDFSLELAFQRSEAQRSVASIESGTDGYNLLNLSGEVPFKTGFGNFKVMTSITNIFDVEARNHTSFLKEVAPLPGRSFSLGLQAAI